MEPPFAFILDELCMRAEMGEALAQYRLGILYHLGIGGVAQDYAEAVQWYRRAAEQGHADAQNNLGLCYDNGQGVPRDDVHAYVWFNLAAARGYADAVKARNLLTSRMTREQIAEAQKLSRQWHERIEQARTRGDMGSK